MVQGTLPAANALGQLCIHRNLDVALNRLRQRTVLLRLLCGLPEGRVVDAGDLSAHFQGAARDLGRPTHRFERDGCARFDARRGMARLLETGRQRHAEATGVGGCEQLFRVRPFLTLEARPEAERTAEYAALRFEAAFAVSELAFPNCDGVAGRHDRLLRLLQGNGESGETRGGSLRFETRSERS